MRRLLLVPALIAGLAACGGSDDDAGTVPSVTTADEPPTTSAAPTRPTTPLTDPVLNPALTLPPKSSVPSGPATVAPGTTDLDRAIADVVARTGVDAAAVTVIDEDAVTWPDSSIGCPQPGMQYMQVIIEGTRIILESDGQRFEYHRGGNRDLFYCAAPQPPVGES